MTKTVDVVRCHTGIMLNQKVLTTIDAKKEKATIELTPGGVHVATKTQEIFVPFANIPFCILSKSEKLPA